jgi:hypothetical protein
MNNPLTRPPVSSRNPFRTPLLTPNPTTSSVPSYHTAVPFTHTLFRPTQTGMSTVSSAPSYHTAAESNVHSDDEDTPETLPELTPRISSRNLSNPRLSGSTVAACNAPQRLFLRVLLPVSLPNRHQAHCQADYHPTLPSTTFRKSHHLPTLSRPILTAARHS